MAPLDTAALTDIRNFIKKRICYMRYRVGSTYYKVDVLDSQIKSDGVVRVQAEIIPSGEVTINRVELYNNNSELWAHQDVNITIDRSQTGVLYWFDFTTKEG